MTQEHGPPTEIDLVRWSEALSAIAKTGLGFSENLYERERYEEVLKVAADIKAAILNNTVPTTSLQNKTATGGRLNTTGFCFRFPTRAVLEGPAHAGLFFYSTCGATTSRQSL